MQTNLYKPGPAARCPEYRPVDGGTMRMWLPGMVQSAVEAAGSDTTKEGFKRLMYAVIIQAIAEGVKGDKSAIRWLRKDAPEWLDVVGFAMNHTTWQTWIDEGMPGTLTKNGKMRWIWKDEPCPEMSEKCLIN